MVNSGAAPEVHHSDQETCFPLISNATEGMNEVKVNTILPIML